jgi:hypothetical protein
MGADVPSARASGTPLEMRIALDQIDALFRSITVSVCGERSQPASWWRRCAISARWMRGPGRRGPFTSSSAR